MEKCRYVAVVGVAFGLVSAIGAFAWGAVKTIAAIARLIGGEMGGLASSFVQIMDAFLVAWALLLFSIGLYELFIGPLDLPGGLVIADFDALKSKLGGVIILVMAVFFVERLETGCDALELLHMGLAIASVSVALALAGRIAAQ